MRTTDKNDYSPTKIIPQLNSCKNAFCSFVGYSHNLYSGMEYCDFAINLFSNTFFFFLIQFYGSFCCGFPRLERARPEATTKHGKKYWSKQFLLSQNMNCLIYKAKLKKKKKNKWVIIVPKRQRKYEFKFCVASCWVDFLKLSNQ